MKKTNLIRTLEEQVVDRLREAIIDGAFEPGDQLNQAQIASQFGTSRGPIRAALIKLEEEGLVNNIPHHGTVIAELTRKTVQDIYGVRAVLEAYAVELAILNITEEDIDCLSKIVHDMQEAANAGNTNKVLANDLAIHEKFIDLSDNQALQQIWLQIYTRVRWVLSIRHRGHHNLRELADSHIPLLEKVIQKDANGASEIMRSHIKDAGNDIMVQWTEKVLSSI
jgi:DNA-binding GntR family transcriptional regulator